MIHPSAEDSSLSIHSGFENLFSHPSVPDAETLASVIFPLRACPELGRPCALLNGSRQYLIGGYCRLLLRELAECQEKANLKAGEGAEWSRGGMVIFVLHNLVYKPINGEQYS